MLEFKRTTVLTSLILATIVGSTMAEERQSSGLTFAEFEKLHKQLQPPQGEAWRTLPWHNSILKAREIAAREKKPIYMLVRSGHPLGCV